MICATCNGTGEIEVSRDCSPSEDTGGMSEMTGSIECNNCHGTGTNTMHITIMNSTFALAFDEADDTPPEWTWEGLVPLCPVCLRKGLARPLLVQGREDTKLAPVVNHSDGAAAVECDACLFTAMVSR